MTGKELMELALNLMGEDENSIDEYNGYSVGIINIIIGETFRVNNSILEANGEVPLAKIPLIKKIEDTIPYDEMLLNNCLSYGLTAKIILESGDFDKFNYFNTAYANAMNDCMKAIPTKIVDLYGGDSY